MISLSTGLPGAGKTLYTIAYVKELAEKEHRPVFYSGIKDLALPWHEIEADKWMDCPEGAIIVIDECQRIFRPRGNGSKVPAYVSELETHRHKGFDIFLVTQHPMLMDSNVRRLTERHWHIARRFGMQRTTIFQFESCKEQPLSNTATAQRIEWKYPKDVFDLYKSAEVHTVKRRLPMQYLMIIVVPIIVIALLWYFIQRHYSDGKMVIPGTEGVQQQTSTSGSGEKRPGKESDRVKPMTTAEYVEAYKPRIPGLAYTAPVYDKVTEPQEAPIPAACVESKSKGCKCYSQQGTVLDTGESLCHQVVHNGFFQAFALKSNTEQQARPEKLAKAVPVAPVPQAGQSMDVVPAYAQPGLPSVPQSSVIGVAPGNDSTNPRFNVALRGIQ